MSVKNKVPDIRFKGFSGEWEERSLDSVYRKIRNAFVGTATPYYVKEGNFYLESNNVKDGKINRKTEIFINDEFYHKQSDKWLREGDIVMVQSGHVGHTAVIPPELNNIAAHALIMFADPKEEVSPYFLNFQFQTENIKTKLSEITTGNTIKHILSSEMKDFEMFFTDFEEQTAIGNTFQKLDNLINQHQQKHDKLSNIKKAMLEKMFPKQGENIPEIRFKGFSGEWEESLLAEEAVVTTGYPFDSVDFSENGDLLVVTNGNIQNSSSAVDGKVGNRIASEKVTHLNQYKLNFGDILVTMDGSVGRTAKVIDRNQILAQRVGRLVARNDTEFLYQSLNTGAFLETMTTISHGGTIKHISLSEIGSYIVQVPKDFNEQAKIGAYLKKLDALINQHQQQIIKLNNIKQACLSKIFV